MHKLKHLEEVLDISFVDSPQHPLSIVLLEYWESLRTRADQIPPTTSWDPIAIPKVLPFVSLIDVSDNGHRFFIRMTGTGAAALGQEDRTGMYVDEIAGKECKEVRDYLRFYWNTLCRASYETALLFHYTTTIAETGRDYVALQISVYPMANLHGDVTRILIGCFDVSNTKYH